MGLKSINNGNYNEQLDSLQQQLQQKDSIIQYQQEQYNQLILTVRHQEQLLTEKNAEISLLNNEAEKLMQLAESQKQLEQQNIEQRNKIKELESELTTEKKQSETLQNTITTITDKYNSIEKKLPSLTEITETKKSLYQLIDTATGLNKVAEDTRITNYISWGVVAVFVLMCGAVGWMSYGAKTQATKAHTAIIQGIYDNEGWSILSGSQSDIVHQQYKKQHPNN